VLNIFDKAPVIDKDVFVAPSAVVIGDVEIGKGSSIWYGSVLRGKGIQFTNFISMSQSQHLVSMI
jgi:carbonic anhydrase/acetyltransferase-like protein (isoleucine patch superfamily)